MVLDENRICGFSVAKSTRRLQLNPGGGQEASSSPTFTRTPYQRVYLLGHLFHENNRK
jgi:hypothetical protein